MQQQLTGQQPEQAILQKALQSGEPEMVAVTGRRRMGKTFLVRSVYAGKIDFGITGAKREFAGATATFYRQAELPCPSDPAF